MKQVNQLRCSISLPSRDGRALRAASNKGERGFALPMVVFFMVVVGMLVAGMTRLSMLNRASTDLELQSERAHWVARSAVEYWRHAAGHDKPCDRQWPSTDGFRVVIEHCDANTLVLRAETAGGDLSAPDYVSWRESAKQPR